MQTKKRPTIFSESECTTTSSIKGKGRLKDSYTRKTLQLKTTHHTNRKLHINRIFAQKMVQYEDNFDDDSTLSLVIHPQSDPAIGQVQLSHNLISNFTRKRKLPIKTRIS